MTFISTQDLTDINLMIKPGSLILLSGPSASGKSTFAGNYPKLVLSSDQFRKDFFGVDPILVDGDLAMRPRAMDDGLVFQTLEAVVDARLKKGLTTMVDATLLNDKSRKPFADIAEKYHAPLLVLIFEIPEETLLARDRNRTYRVGEKVIKSQLERFQRDSKYSYYVGDSTSFKLNFVTNELAYSNIDVIGDIHGCYDELLMLLFGMGWELNGFDLTHPKGRALLFLGDLCDRGTQSLEVLHLVMHNLKRPGFYCVRGNHEDRLLRALRDGQIPGEQSAVRETIHKVLELTSGDQQEIIDFLAALPSFYTATIKGIRRVFVHGNISSFQVTQPSGYHIYGEGNYRNTPDTDACWRKGMVTHLIRGHISLTSPNEEEGLFGEWGGHVVALDQGAGLGGNICALRVHKNGAEKFFSKRTGDYRVRRAQTIQGRLTPLVRDKLVNLNTDSTGRLGIYKYSRKAFSKSRYFLEHSDLKLARGLVLGLHGQPVNAPFPRVFNYLEQGAGQGISRNQSVIAVEKLNGFLASTCWHPYENRLLVTTSGSFESEFVDIATQELHQSGWMQAICTYLSEHPQHTLLWEIISEKDTLTHPIEYGPEMLGPHLIGVGTWDLHGNLKIFDEAYREGLLESLGCRGPMSEGMELGELLYNIRTCQHEGYMVRNLEGDYLFKLKSPYYLSVKFLQRLSEKNIGFLFQNPEEFARRVDEDFSFLVHHIASEYTESTWARCSESERREIICRFVREEYQWMNTSEPLRETVSI